MQPESRKVQTEEILELAVVALEDLKARELTVMNVGELTSVTDYMVVASGTSDRHVKAMASSVVGTLKEAGHAPYGVEGAESGQWVLVDLQDVVVHIMQPKVREFYKLEKLWDMSASDADTESGSI